LPQLRYRVRAHKFLTSGPRIPHCEFPPTLIAPALSTETSTATMLLLPNQSAQTGITPATFASHTTTLRTSLLNVLPTWPHDTHLLMSPYPIYTPPHRLAEIHTLYSALHPALLGLVKAWWTRPELYLSIPVPEKIERVLRRLEDIRKFERVGSIRPDFIVPEKQGESVRICEINARFMFNGYFTGTLHGEGIEDAGRGWCKDKGYSVGGDVEELKKHFSTLFDSNKPIALVTGRENRAPWDLDIVCHMYPTSRIVASGDLHLVRPTTEHGVDTVVLADSHGPLNQFLLELHQDEIELLDEEVLFELGKHCWNDLRTIYLIHDKRILGLIRRELKWLVDTGKITREHAEILRNGLAETYILDEAMCQDLLTNMKSGDKDQWTLKKARSGKGDGMMFGKDMDDGTWRGLIERYSASAGKVGEEATVPYVLQRYVRSKRLDLFIHDTSAGKNVMMKRVRWNVVGMVLCIDRILFPNTMWRANQTDIVALGRSGQAFAGVGMREEMRTFTVPATRRELVPLRKLVLPSGARVQAPVKDGHAKQAEQVKRALEKDGLAVVDLGFEDKDSAYMVALTGMLGKPLDHSSKQGILWDVRPVEGLHAGNAARSETMEPFPWHTDCSFECAPPRYFALHILHRDRFGGGNLRLLHVDSLLPNLSSTTMETLRLPQFKLLVPKEFRKDVGYIVGSLLMTDPFTGHQKLRYRREIIEPLSVEAEKALMELEEWLGRVDAAGEHGPVVACEESRERSAEMVEEGEVGAGKV
ncbi:hypothetical protein BC938DRAFT_483476, partial [Jimgerdemannia flammicorona]